MSITNYPYAVNPYAPGLKFTRKIFEGKVGASGFYTYTGTLKPGYYFLVGNIKFSYGPNVVWNNSNFGSRIIRVLSDETSFTIGAINWNSATANAQVRFTTAGFGKPKQLISDGTKFYTTSQSSVPAIYSSTDGITWSSTGPFNGNAINDIAYESTLTNKYIIVGASSDLHTSTDAVTWTSRTSNAGGDLSAVTINPNVTNKYVSCGTNGRMVTSTDGVTWSSRTTGTSTSLTNIVTSKGTTGDVYVACGTSVLISSTDGITWTSRFPTVATSGATNRINYVQSNYWFFNPNGGSFISTDGITWTVKTPSTYSGVFYNQGYYVTGSSTATSVSTDGNTWNISQGNLFGQGSATFNDIQTIGSMTFTNFYGPWKPGYAALYELGDIKTYG